MNPQDAIDFSREALKTCMMVGGPILVASLLIGLLIGVFQAMTQVQDQTVSFVPKILLLIVMIGLCLPWLTDQMLDFAKQSFEKPMTQWSGSSHRGLFPKSTGTAEAAKTKSVSYNRPEDRKAMLTVEPSAKQLLTPQPPTGFPGTRNTAPRFELPNASEISPMVPMKSPFILPHYRISKGPKSEIDG